MIVLSDDKLVSLTMTDGTTMTIYATARQDGAVWQGGIYCRRADQIEPTQWLNTWGRNRQIAMRNVARRTRIDARGGQLVIEFEEA